MNSEAQDRSKADCDFYDSCYDCDAIDCDACEVRGYLDKITELSASLEFVKAERDRFKARAKAAEADMKRMADDIDGETDACYPCAICAKNNSRCDTSDNCFEWRGPQEGANK